MAQLIHMRQRIKAVETIKKITHAMRLISMSMHSRLRHKKAQFEEYKNTFLELASYLPTTNIPHTITHSTPKELILLVGSQKGLCGAFNTHLFKFFENAYPTIPDTTDIICIGKHAIDFMAPLKKPILEFNDFTMQRFVPIAIELTDFIIQHQASYSRVVAFTNFARTFFVQKPHRTTIFPADAALEKSVKPSDAIRETYLFEDDPEALSEYINKMLLTITIEELLFESLLAEQSARFLSMDASTRNAEKLIVEMKLEYNKTRQAAITRELTELSSAL